MATLTTKARNNLSDSDFAYVDAEGEGHLPIHDKAHVNAALSRFSQTDIPANKEAAVAKKIVAAAKSFDIEVDPTTPVGKAAGLKQTNSLRRPKKMRHRSKGGLGLEVRLHSAEGIEVRESRDGSDTIEIHGTPIVYNQPYTVRDLYGEFEETMEPGVAAGCIAAGSDTRFLFNHGGLPLARSTSGTLSFRDGMNALEIVAVLDSRQSLANDLAVAIERGDVSQMSCGFVVGSDSWNGAMDQRSISEFQDFVDVSAVTYPASPTTSIALAQRMAMEMPVESRARLRKMVNVAIDLRAGKALSAANAQHVANAIDALNNVIAQASPDDLPQTAQEETDTPDIDSNPNGDLQGPSTTPAQAQDGTGSRSAFSVYRAAGGSFFTSDLAFRVDGSFNDIQSALSCALQDKLGDGDPCDLWVSDAGPDWVVWQQYGDDPGLFKAGYSVDDDLNVTFESEPVPVARVTTYQEQETDVPSLTGRSAEDIQTEVKATIMRLAQTVAEVRDAPTAEDPKVAAAITAAQAAVTTALACQAKDPDAGTDPDDAAVLEDLKNAEAALEAAATAQDKDGKEDPAPAAPAAKPEPQTNSEKIAAELRHRNLRRITKR